jgi:hypothetical protein
MTSPPLQNQKSEGMTFSGLLRLGGALLVVAAMCSHLLEGWQQWSDVSRYYVMLGGSAMLTLAGFLMTFVLHENKSARVFFGLGLLSVVANVTTLGGLLHDAVQWDAATIKNAWITDFAISDTSSLALIVGSAIALLTPLAWFTFKVLVRPHATSLLACFAVTVGLILVPVRESLGVGILIALALTIPLAYWHNVCRNNLHFATGEGRFALAALFAPAIIMLARLLWLYEADALLLWVLTAMGLVVNRYLSRIVNQDSGWAHLNNIGYVLLALTLGGLSAHLIEPHVAHEMALATFGLAGGLAIWHKGRDGNQAFYSVMGLGLLQVTTILGVLFYDSLTASLVCAAAGLVGFILAFIERNGPLKFMSITTALIGLLPRAWELLELIDFTHWSTLTVMGVLVIIASAAIERLRSPAATPATEKALDVEVK